MSQVHWKEDEASERYKSNVQDKVCVNFANEDTISESGSTFASSSVTSYNERHDFCTRCKQIIEQLQEEKRQLGAQLIEQSYHMSKFNNTCKCKLKQDIELIQREERCLLETIELKKERLENLKQSDEKLSGDIKIIKENASDKLATYNDICKCLENTEESYNNKCQDIKNKQNINIELDKNIKKLQSDAKQLVKRISIEQQKYDGLKLELNKLIELKNDMQEKLEAEKKMVLNFDAVATDFQAKIKHLKSELKMLSESQQFHQQEVLLKTQDLAKMEDESKKYASLIDKAKSEVNALKQTLQTHQNFKSDNDKLLTEIRGETQELEQLLEKEKNKKILLIQKLNTLKEMNENTKLELKTNEENYKKLTIIIKNVKDSRCNVEEELLKLVNNERQKIKLILDECSHYELMFKDCLLVKNLLEKDNQSLESSLVPNKPNNVILNLRNTEQGEVAGDQLDSKLVRHHEAIKEIQQRFTDTQNMFDKLRNGQSHYDWCSSIREQHEVTQPSPSSDSDTTYSEITRIGIKFKCSNECTDNGFCCQEVKNIVNLK